MKIEELENKKILIVGYGVEGKATYEFLEKFVPSATVAVVDQKDGPGYLDGQASSDLAVRSPGVKKELIKIPYTTAANIFFANVKGKVVGVTGSKGKSTTSALIAHICEQSHLKVSLCGNIGRPMLQALIDEPEAEIFVVELSSFQLEDANFSPHISVITSLFPEHMDYHGDFKMYLQAKKKIVAFAKPEDYYVYNPSFPELVHLASETSAKATPYVSVLPFSKDIVTLIGEHNLENVRGAVTVAQILGISSEVAAKAISTFKALPHRLENIGAYHGITFYDDAISTTPQSAMAAVKSLNNISTIFLGGTDRGYDFDELAQLIVKSKIQNIVIFPDSGQRILAALQKYSSSPLNVLQTSSMEEAVKFAYKFSSKESICLLSTASPSYSLWKNFEEKGQVFKENVIKQSKIFKII
ncbi:MAG: UDP-N-acetylmuramoyl-L-alanine--D-glutamate ligase [Patescibacteria group bacterium]|nr:UDP-N-acetylmuramoyl-L-alanine--D-glutamate ligase [Patescibacteria group bacterium]